MENVARQNNLVEIVLKCLNCGIEKQTGTYTQRVVGEEIVAYSHGYCNMRCAEEQLNFKLSDYKLLRDIKDEWGQ
jgi:hypothetical protein